MGQNWYDPQDFTEWFKRTCSLLNMGVLLFSVLFVFSEFRFNWCEKLIGGYLISINAQRPEIGAIWETGHETLDARDSVKRILTRKNDIKRNVEGADSFLALGEGLRSGEWLTLEKEQFKRLYQSLPISLARHLIEPVRLIWLINGPATDRIFCEGHMDGISVYFIDAGNRVLQQMEFKRSQLKAIYEKQRVTPGALEDFSVLNHQIYGADNFFKAVFQLPKDVRHDLIPSADLLLAQHGELLRVGIGHEAEEGFIELGFEFKYRGKTGVLLTRARDWAVWQLGLILKGVPR